MRAGLAALALVGLATGVWATLSPARSTTTSPAAGAWVAADGPYNEHLVRDFGSLNLALAAVTIMALVTLGRAVVIAAAVAWLLVEGAPPRVPRPPPRRVRPRATRPVSSPPWRCLVLPVGGPPRGGVLGGRRRAPT